MNIDRYKSQSLYLLRDLESIKLVNRLLFVFYYFIFFVIVYQFMGRSEGGRSYAAYFILFFLFFYPFLIHRIQTFFYGIMKYLFFYVSNKVYFNDD
jgi:O-antigen ligase